MESRKMSGTGKEDCMAKMTDTTHSCKNEIHGYFTARIELDDKGQPFDWTYVYANEEVARIEGKSLEQLKGHRFLEIFPNGDRKWLELFCKAAYQGESVSLDDISDETGIYLHVEAYPTDREGYCACVVCDIKNNIFTRLKQQEEQESLLKAYEEEKQHNLQMLHYAEAMGIDLDAEHAIQQAIELTEMISALSTIYTTIMEADLLTHGFKIILTHSPMKTVVGGKNQGNFDEVMEDVLKFYMHPDDIDRMREFVDLSTVSDRLGSETTLVTEYRAPYGKWFESRFIAKKRDEAGHVISAIYAARDITAEKLKDLHYQQQLKAAAEEAERANKTKTEFLLRMSHDIRTPLNGIRGMLDMADYYGSDLEKVRECRRKVRESSNILLELINEVLDMSKLESGEVTPEHVPFDLEGISYEVFTVVEKLAEEQGIEIIEDCNMQHSRLIGSPIHFKRLLLNILGNAIKYNRPHGKVYVSCREISFDGKTAVLEMVIRDTGIGMSEEFQKHLFEPFSQENASVRSKYGGTGLGLSIAKSLAEKLGGTIACESKKDVGTTFTVEIPFEVDLSQPVDMVHDSEEEISIAGETVILAEDNDINLEIAQFLLSGTGANVIVARNGEEAVAAFAAAKPGEITAILMDLMMPVMDGYEATRRIRAMDRTDAATIPIIAMTANAFVEDRIATKKAGMNAHITKPLDANNVIRIIAEQIKEASVGSAK